MKQTLVLLVLTFSIFTTKSFSQDWEKIIQTEEETYFYKPNTRDTAWIKIVSEQTEYYSEKTEMNEIVDGYKMMLWKYNCKGKKMGIIQIIVYNKNGETLSSFKENELLVDMDYVVPDSLGEELFNVFCKD